MTLNLPRVSGPHDLPDLRHWMVEHWRPGGPLTILDEHRFMSRNLPTAKLWWVEPEACDLLASAAPTWPDEAVLDMGELPTPCGLAVFAHDFIGSDADPEAEGRDVYVSAILWAPANLPPRADRPASGISIAMFSRLVLEDGLTSNQMEWAHKDLYALAESLRDRRGATVTEGGEAVAGHLFSFVGRTDWLDGWPASRILSDNPHGDNPHTAASMAEDRKLLASLWQLTRSKFVESTTTKPRRHIARRSERKGLDASVRVLSLGGERTHHPVTAGTTEWKHSWVVSPHWRWQPCGPGRSERRLVLVDAYYKGPADKPLIGGERVWRVAAPKGVE